MIITVNRFKPVGEYLDGTLSINGEHVCDTTENACSCVPAGLYTIVCKQCRQQARKVHAIKLGDNEPPCELCPKRNGMGDDAPLACICPQIKRGNGTCNLHDGRILVGTRFVTGVVEHSQESYGRISERIRKAMSRGNPVTIIINDSK